MSKGSKQKRQAAPPETPAGADHATPLPVLLEIRDLLQEQVTFIRWLIPRLAGSLGV
jgi:hypothetical protein